MVSVEITAAGVSAAVAAILAAATANVFVINAIVGRRLTAFLRDLNGTYTRSAKSPATGAELEAGLKGAANRLESLWVYAHESLGKISNNVTVLFGLADKTEMRLQYVEERIEHLEKGPHVS